MKPLFFTGIHQPSDAYKVDRAMISINRLEGRVSDFNVGEWLLDSGAFTRISTGKGHLELKVYVEYIQRWATCGTLLAAVSQDYMCEPFILVKTGQTVNEHQAKTIARYWEIRELLDPAIYLMPVLQGYAPGEYVDHIRQYGPMLKDGMWVGVGSVCKRNASPRALEVVLDTIAQERPDLRLHGFGIKTTALRYERVNRRLYSCDSMAWSFAARRGGRNPNDVREAIRFAQQIADQPIQLDLFGGE